MSSFQPTQSVQADKPKKGYDKSQIHNQFKMKQFHLGICDKDHKSLWCISNKTQYTLGIEKLKDLNETYFKLIFIVENKQLYLI